MKKSFSLEYLRLSYCLIVLLSVVSAAIYFFELPSAAQNKDKAQTRAEEAIGLADFRQSAKRKIKPVIVELREDPGAVVQFQQGAREPGKAFEALSAYAMKLADRQDDFRRSLPERGVQALMRETDVRQIDGSMRRIEYRFTYLLNGFVAYIPVEDLEQLRAQPEVKNVYEIERSRLLLDSAIDYSLGTQFNVSDRRLATYGANQELTPLGSPGHPETPRSFALDGFEGQNINVAIIDSGVDWRHPMFGGTGLNTPVPRVSGNQARADDNRKVIYYYAMSSPGDPTDDFGHGTLVASTAVGYAVDGNTPPNPGYGTGRDGTGIGPTITGARYHGTAPQARIMGYKVCGPAPQCPGDIPLSMEDAASPYTLVRSGVTATIPVPKPVADVINLSLGDTAGSATAASAVAANNAALNGTIVVASAGNSGPGAGTIGSPSAATLAISVAASLDPGSVAGADVLQGDQIINEQCDGNPSRPPDCNTGGILTPTAGPAPEYGAASNANAAGTPIGIKLFPVAGGGPIRDNSLSAHYAYVDLAANPPTNVPESVRNRIALVKFTGTFASGANPVATKNPSAILLISNIESATAVQVINGIPTFTISVTNANILLDLLIDGMQNSSANPPHGAVSLLPLRAAQSISLDAYTPQMASFSSRGPNDHPTANYRQIKPDVTAPGVGIEGAATAEGLPDDTIGLASLTGYTVANGTSFSGPITAGAITVIRQRVRNELGLDTTNLNDANYRLKRFDAVTVSRALLQNSATNLRTGRGVPEPDPAPTGSVNDLGSGHINVAGALALRAIMVSPTLLLADADPNTTGNQSEFTRPTRNAPPLDSNGNLEVLLPTASFGNQSVVGVISQKTFTRKVIVRDITRGAGGGTYNLTFQNNRNVDGTNFAVSFSSNQTGTAPITSVRVPSGGQAVFYVRVQTQNVASETEFQWFIKATHSTSGQELRMPFYFRAVGSAVAGVVAPVQNAPTNVENTTTTPCPTDTNGMYTLNWSYTVPPGGLTPIGYRIQEGSSSTSVFFDPANMPLVNGANSMWSGSPQWTTQANPTSPNAPPGNLAYFVPDTANQNESLAMINQVNLAGATGASLSFVTNQDTEQDFDFMNVEISNNNGTSWTTLASYSGTFVGVREIDISAFAGQMVRVRFRMVSDLVAPAPGTYIEDIRITTNDFVTIADVPPTPLMYDLTRPNGTRNYRIAGRFNTENGQVAGPYSNVRCVTVAIQ